MEKRLRIWKKQVLKLWWWTDVWADGHTSGLNDAVYSNNDDGKGKSLTADVTLPSVGNYYIVAELKLGSNSLCTEFVTLTTTEDTSINGAIDVKKISGLSDEFIMGLDISSIVSEYNSGVTFQDFEGKTLSDVNEFCAFLKKCGITHIRVRVWNNPYDADGNGYGGGNNDVNTAVIIAKACQRAGLKMLVDFHYSDFWADPGKQQVPKEWSSYTLEQKKSAVAKFTTDSLKTIRATGVDVDMVQVGNETTNSFVGEKGTNYADMCQLFQAGSQAVKKIDSEIKVVIHFTNPERTNQLVNWAKRLFDNGVYYWEPAWITVGDTTGLKGAEYTAQVDKNKVLWETYGSGWASSFAKEYDAEDAGKWFGGSAVDNQAFFYADGTPNAALHVWEYVKTGAVSNTVSVNGISSAEESIEVNGTYTFPEKVTVTYNKGAVEEAVIWDKEEVDKIDVSRPGVYMVHGKVTFSKTVNTGDYSGKTEAPVTYTLTVKEANLITDKDAAGFEDGSSFVVEGTGIKAIPSKEDVLEGSGTLHWYNATAVNSSVTYDAPLTLEAGCYTFEAAAMGYAGDTVTLKVLDTEGNELFTGASKEMAGWTTVLGECQKPSVTFCLDKETQVKLQICLGISNGGWGSADALYLHKHQNQTVKEQGEGTHLVSCADCAEELYSEECKWDEGVVTTEPTYATEGVKTFTCSICKATKTETIDRLEEPGEVIWQSNAEKNALNAEILVSDNTDLGKLVLTEEEKQRVQEGEDARISLEVLDISESVSAEEKAEIKKVSGNLSVGIYLDINLYKQIGSDEKQKVEKPNGKLAITIRVPDEMISKTNTNYVYKMIRIHEGEAKLLDGMFDSEAGTFTFETDRFSTYALVYGSEAIINGPDEPSKSESAAVSNNTTKPEKTANAVQTGDAANPMVYIGVMMICMFVFGTVIVMRKKRHR